MCFILIFQAVETKAKRIIEVQTTGGSYEDEIIETLSDAKLNYTEVVSQWHDVDGINGSRDYFYVLIRIEKNRAKELLMQFGR